MADSGEEGERGTYFCHIVCELGSIDLTETLGDVRKFLDTHPDEFLIMVIEDYIDPEDVEKAFRDSGLVRYAYVHERNTPFPTLRELIQQDKRILVMAENDNGGGLDPVVPRRLRADAGDPVHVQVGRRAARRRELQAEPRHAPTARCSSSTTGSRSCLARPSSGRR